MYAAEDQLVATLERAGAGATIEFFGSQLTLPEERKFADLDSVRRYLDAVCSDARVLDRYPFATVPEVRGRKGPHKAHYSDGVIALPVEQRWAGRETVVLHELAHHLMADEQVTAHGPEFVSTYVFLVETVLGAEAGLLLRAALDGAGVQVT